MTEALPLASPRCGARRWASSSASPRSGRIRAVRDPVIFLFIGSFIRRGHISRTVSIDGWRSPRSRLRGRIEQACGVVGTPG